MTKGLYETHLF